MRTQSLLINVQSSSPTESEKSEVVAFNAQDLQNALQQKNYPVLMKALKKILNTIGFCEFDTTSQIENENTYKELLRENASRLAFVLANEMYTHQVDNHFPAQLVHDTAFFLCQANPDSAGKVLNKHIWKFWHHNISDWLIKYGAQVNITEENDKFPILFKAIRGGVPKHTLRNLITHGAPYDCKVEAEGKVYPLMIVAALEVNLEALATLIEKFPDKVNAAVEFIDEMERHFESGKYSCLYNDNYQSDPKKTAYTMDDITKAKLNLIRLKMEHSCFHGRSLFGGLSAYFLPTETNTPETPSPRVV